MEEKIKEIERRFLEEIKGINSIENLEILKIKYLGRKGILNQFFSELPKIDISQRAFLGRLLNELKRKVCQGIEGKEKELSEKKELREIDVTLPGVRLNSGKRHILTQTIETILSIFENLGFVVVEGPEIETEYYNFSALNIPPEHPATEAFHTFYLETQTESSFGRYLLRSQTSTVQVRVMEKFKPPIRVVSPGKVYRPDAVDASHSFMFHQVEGFAVDKNIRFSDLKGTLFAFAQRFFGKEIKMRFRPHYFPFTEPSVEVDISCIICKGKGCRVCGRKGWLEILGAGMIHPFVFQSAGYLKRKYTGFAFGMGVERIAMLKYGIDDIRLFFANDLRFLTQF